MHRWTMALLIGLGCFAAAALPRAAAAQTPEACAPVGDVQFVCGHDAPEDLVAIPGTDWVLASSLTGKGVLLVDARTRTTTTLYPSESATIRPDKAAYPDCPGPLAFDDKAKFDSHGLAVRATGPGRFRLHVVHHGQRESVEVFDLDVRGKAPAVTWIGCAVAPEPVGLNSVVGLPDGGFIATNFMARGMDPVARRAKLAAGEITGDLREWRRGKGWVTLPGSEASGPNGVELSSDGRWIYVAAYGDKSVIRMSRGRTPPKRDVIPLGFQVDNIHRAADGWLYAAGRGEGVSRAVRIDPRTLKVADLVTLPNMAVYASSTVALPVGRDIWLGASRQDRIAIVPPVAGR